MHKKYPLMGFTLIELMIVVLIIGILTSMSLPSYRRYLARARFAEVIAATEPYKIAVSLALQQGYPLTDLKNNITGIPEKPLPTKNMAELKVENGIITAIGSALVKNASYILTPNEDGSRWTITGTCITAGICEA